MKVIKYSTQTRIINNFFNTATLIVLTSLIACSSTGALKGPEKQTNAFLNLSRNIDQILQDSSLQQTRTGIKIVSLQTGKTLYERNSQELFHPASNMKLLTTATALKRLGTNFRFKTILYADTASITDSTLSGNIYLKGFGNPDLSVEDLWWMVRELKSRGISRINGNLICDETYMDDLYWGSGWMWDDVSAWYWAPICALTVNDNCVRVTVKPGSKIGDSLTVQLEPRTNYLKIVNMGVTVDSLDTLQQRAFKVERNWRPAENTIKVEGGMAIGKSERSFVIDVVDAARFTGTLFSELLQQENITFEGKVLKDSVPDKAIVLVRHISSPLTLIIMNTNKISDNLSAELLMKTVGAEIKGVPGTAEKGISVVKEVLSDIGVDSTTYEIADGSGVSRYNVITPDLIVDLLTEMNRDFRIQAEYKTSLPIAGIDGTLQGRMKNSAAEGKLRAKTGSLRGVSSLAGYTTTAEGELVAFSMIMEHFIISTSKIRDIQDQIGNLISSFSRK